MSCSHTTTSLLFAGAKIPTSEGSKNPHKFVNLSTGEFGLCKTIPSFNDGSGNFNHEFYIRVSASVISVARAPIVTVAPVAVVPVALVPVLAPVAVTNATFRRVVSCHHDNGDRCACYR